MTNTTCRDGLVDVWVGGEWELSACPGCVNCDPAQAAARAAADRTWIRAQARRVQLARAAAPLIFRAS